MELPVDMASFNCIEWMIFGVFTSSLVFSSFFVFLTLSKKIRYSIPSTVNCWFCNENTKVPYALGNNWTCPKCHQYNGFAEDGGYNKRIPAQYIESLNRPVEATKGGMISGRLKSNGLCSQCNLNQELKCFQLASYVPSKDVNFEREIEIEQKRLEEIYDLCNSCKTLVNHVLKPSGDNVAMQRSEVLESKVIKPSKQVSQSTAGETFNRSKSTSSQSQENFNHFSDTETEDEEENNVKMENLQIGSPAKQGIQWFPSKAEPLKTFDINFGNPNPVLGLKSYSIPPSPPLSVTPPYQSQFVSFSNSKNDCTPMYRDCAILHNSPAPGVPSCYSVCDGNSYLVGRPNPTSFSPASFYHYRSSSMGTVFGGRKPLISPPKLPSRIPAQQSCFTSFGGYGVFYGTTGMLMPPHFGNPLSRSSSQSSGFISQYGMSSTPTHSRFSTAPNSIYSEPLYPPVYSEQIRRPSQAPPCNAFSHRGNLSPNPMIGPFGGFHGLRPFNGDICSRLGPRGEKLDVLNESQLYSDDENSSMDDSFQTAPSTITVKTKRSAHSRSGLARERSRTVHLDSKLNNTNDDNNVTLNQSIIRNILATVTLIYIPKNFRIFYQIFLRLFLFAMILIIFCLFFVGKWPNFLEPYLSIATDYCDSGKTYLEETFPSLDIPIHCRVVGYFHSPYQSQDEDSNVI